MSVYDSNKQNNKNRMNAKKNVSKLTIRKNEGEEGEQDTNINRVIGFPMVHVHHWLHSHVEGLFMIIHLPHECSWLIRFPTGARPL